MLLQRFDYQLITKPLFTSLPQTEKEDILLISPTPFLMKNGCMADRALVGWGVYSRELKRPGNARSKA